MSRGKNVADHRADLRGGRFIGLPKVVYDSPAYHSLPPHARCCLLAVLSRMMGYNNGKIAVSYAEIAKDLGNSNRRKIGESMAALLDRGFIDVEADARWKLRKAREYRITFVNTSNAAGKFDAASNDYLKWKPDAPPQAISSGNASSPVGVVAGIASSPPTPLAGNASSPGQHRVSLWKAKKRGGHAGDASVPLISKPYPGAANDCVGEVGQVACPACGTSIGGRASKRYCSEPCRKKAERQRHQQRVKQSAHQTVISGPVCWFNRGPAILNLEERWQAYGSFLRQAA